LNEELRGRCGIVISIVSVDKSIYGMCDVVIIVGAVSSLFDASDVESTILILYASDLLFVV
jgi:coenzyme F420-reducing hydrogenase gamma subunit